MSGFKWPSTERDQETHERNKKIQRYADLMSLRQACLELNEPHEEILDEIKQLKKELKG